MSLFIDLGCDCFQVTLKQNWNKIKINNCSINGNYYEAVTVYHCTINWNLHV